METTISWQHRSNTVFHMRRELDPKVADRLVFSAVAGLWPSRGKKILCTRRVLKQAFLAVAQEAYEIGFLAGQKMRLPDNTHIGRAARPPWMDIRLDDPAALATHRIRLKPVVLRSLLGAGHQCLGDLRWVSSRQLTDLFYIGRKTAQQIRAALERLERDA
jgi:hypothetical protein